MCVCSGVRAVLFTEPSALTSLKSLAHAALVSCLRTVGAELRGALDQKRPHLTDPRGRVEHLRPIRVQQRLPMPGSEFGTHGDGPKRPSPCRAAIIASAAAFPAAIPRDLRRVSGIAASDVAYSVASDCQQARPVRERDARQAPSRRCWRGRGTPRSRQRRPSRPSRWNRRLEEIRPMPRLDRVDGVVDGALGHRHVDLECRRCSARRPRERDERVRRDPVPVRDLVGLRYRRRGERDRGERSDCRRPDPSEVS